MQQRLLLLSTSTVHGSEFLGYCREEVRQHFGGIGNILFVPYARPGGVTMEAYTTLVREKLAALGFSVTGIHEHEDAAAAVKSAQAIYIGGGNTFLLLKSLYEQNLFEVIRSRVGSGEIPYMGSSAGTNVACAAINNTNDMPIVYPPSLKALSLVPFNVNPHYLDPDPASTHKGETRETRIREFHFQSNIPVIGLREGSWLKVNGSDLQLGGRHTARIFLQGKPPYEAEPGTNLNFLMKAGKV